MKRKALLAIALGIALTVVPAANAVWLSDGATVKSPIHNPSVSVRPDILGGNGSPTTVSIRSDVLGGNGSPASVSLRPDVLGGNGGSQVREVPILGAPDNSFAWNDAAYGAAITLMAMLLAATAVYTTRRRSHHRLSF